MAFYQTWDVKNDFTFALQFFSLISDGLAGMFLLKDCKKKPMHSSFWPPVFIEIEIIEINYGVPVRRTEEIQDQNSIRYHSYIT